MNKYAVGKNIKLFCRMQNMTLDQLAEEIGVSHDTISRWDVRNGKAGKLPNDKLIQKSSAPSGDMNGYVNGGFSSGDDEEIPFD